MTNEQIADIAKNMSKGKWGNSFTNFSHFVGTEERYFAVEVIPYDRSHEQCEANAAAICLSINSTFGQNINPEKIGDAVNFLELIARKLPSESERQFLGATTYSIPFTFAEIKEIENLLHDLKIQK